MSLNTRSKTPLGVVAADNTRTSNTVASETSCPTKDQGNRTSKHQAAQRRADEPVPLRRARTTTSQGVGKLPVVVESDAESADLLGSTSVIALLEDALRQHSSTPRRTTTKPTRSIAKHDENILYETSHSLPASNHRPSLWDLKDLSISNVGQIPGVGLTEEGEYNVVEQAEYSPFTVDVPPVRNVSPPVFIQAPTSSVDPALRSVTPSPDMDDDTDCLLRVRISPVKRKPVPVRTLSEISRERLLAKHIATKPYTPSLLSFTEDTTPAQRLRFHPDRFFKSRNMAPDTDALRKTSVERSRLVRVGFIFPSRSQAISDERERAVNPYTFPRAGNLRHLRSVETNTWVEDWSLGYVNLGFIHKTLFAFDLRMRTGHDLWVEEEHEILASFGRNREWETDWEVRWRVASWLMHYSDDEEEEEADLSFASPAFTRPELMWD